MGGVDKPLGHVPFLVSTIFSPAGTFFSERNLYITGRTPRFSVASIAYCPHSSLVAIIASAFTATFDDVGATLSTASGVRSRGFPLFPRGTPPRGLYSPRLPPPQETPNQALHVEARQAAANQRERRPLVVPLRDDFGRPAEAIAGGRHVVPQRY